MADPIKEKVVPPSAAGAPSAGAARAFAAADAARAGADAREASSTETIPFSRAACVGRELEYVRAATESGWISGDHAYTFKCNSWLEAATGASKALLTTSGTHALELAALLLGIKPGDEVVMPSFTFSSTANAFVLRGARIAFVDIRPDTMNLDEKRLEEALTPRTKAVVPVHYAGVAAEMDAVLQICQARGVAVVEDAAQAILARYKGRPLGTIGDLGCLSFHETKNITCGEGGALLARDEKYAQPAEIVREKGTNRAQFFRGQVDKYRWLDVGSSYLPSDLNAAFLLGQLEEAEAVIAARLRAWRSYGERLEALGKAGRLELPRPPAHCEHNGHIFFVKARDLDERARLMARLRERGIQTTFHYVPLHSAPAGVKYGYFAGDDRHTTKESERLVRLPLWHGIAEAAIDRVCSAIHEFYRDYPQRADGSAR
jgi:dTDP-4-amino-4,6-dideoxygalactose transaminase